MKNNKLFVVFDNILNTYYVLEESLTELIDNIESLNNEGGDYEILFSIPDKLAKKLFEQQKEENQTKQDLLQKG